jgi:protein TonB
VQPKFSAFGVSVAIHALLAAVLLFVAGLDPEPVSSKAVPVRTDLVFLQSGAGGGGGGQNAPALPTPIQIPEHRPPAIAVEAVVPAIDPPPTLDLRAQPNANILQGTGTTMLARPGPGGGAGPGTGVGPNSGPGGPGPGRGGSGNDPGSGGGAAIQPRDIRQVKPAYTPGALAAKIQGSVTLEVEVLANGTVGNVRVLKSLDRVYGLDIEAIRAARQWLFSPARDASGRPIDVIVQLILDFNLR